MSLRNSHKKVLRSLKNCTAETPRLGGCQDPTVPGLKGLKGVHMLFTCLRRKTVGFYFTLQKYCYMFCCCCFKYCVYILMSTSLMTVCGHFPQLVFIWFIWWKIKWREGEFRFSEWSQLLFRVYRMHQLLCQKEENSYLCMFVWRRHFHTLQTSTWHTGFKKM